MFHLGLGVELERHVEVVEGRRIDSLLHEVLALLEIHRVARRARRGLAREEREAGLVDGLLEVAIWTPEADGHAPLAINVPESVVRLYY